MALSLESIIKFQVGSGLCLKIISDRDANGSRELPEIEKDLAEFYAKIYPSFVFDKKFRILKSSQESARLYTLNEKKYSEEEYAGTIKIVQKGRTSKADPRPNEDYPIADSTHYYETYFVFFFMKEKPKNQEYRDAFVKFLDPSERKTRMQDKSGVQNGARC